MCHDKSYRPQPSLGPKQVVALRAIRRASHGSRALVTHGVLIGPNPVAYPSLRLAAATATAAFLASTPRPPRRGSHRSRRVP